MQPIPHLIIVGRDGILNEFRTDHIKAPEEWLPVPGALETSDSIRTCIRPSFGQQRPKHVRSASDSAG